jgi:CysZ protein
MKLISQTFYSLSIYKKAWDILWSNKLSKYIWISFFVSIIIYATFIYFGYQWYPEIKQFFIEKYPFEFLESIIVPILTLVFFIVYLFTSFLVLKNILFVVLSPVLSKLSLDVESIYLNQKVKDNTSFLYSIWRGLKISIYILFRQSFLVFFLLIFTWIPILGPIFSLFILLISAYFYGFGTLDYFLERYSNADETKNLIKQNKGLALGNGIGFIGIMFIPFFGFFLAPILSTVAATIIGIEKFNTNFALEGNKVIN